MNRMMLALALLPIACSGVGPDDYPTPETPPPGEITVCSKLSTDVVDCHPPAELCAIFPPPGSTEPPFFYVKVSPRVFPCEEGFACYDQAEAYCESLRNPEFIEDAPPELTPTYDDSPFR